MEKKNYGRFFINFFNILRWRKFYYICTVYITLYDFVPLPGEPGFTCSGGNKQEHAGAHISHLRRCPAPDLHINAKRLVPTLHELPRLQKPPQERLGAMSRILNLCDPTRILHSPPSPPSPPSSSFMGSFCSLCGVCFKRTVLWVLPGILAHLEICT